MSSLRSLLPEEQPVAVVNTRSEHHHDEIAVVATQDGELIKRWAVRCGAQPATGEASSSGPATREVRDGDAGIRFNFPGLSRYRPISWEEWLDHFTRHELLFVYERDTPGKPPSARYRLVKMESLKKKVAEVVKD
jgi:hypothetical protein